METCNRHDWGVEKKELKHIWLPPNGDGQRLNSMRIDLHLKCNSCAATMMNKFYSEEDIGLLYESSTKK